MTALCFTQDSTASFESLLTKIHGEFESMAIAVNVLLFLDTKLITALITAILPEVIVLPHIPA
jgi:hypothetical protein